MLDEHIEYTTNGVPYYWNLFSMHGAAYTIIVNLDYPEDIPTKEQIQKAKEELLTTQDVVRLSVVEHKDNNYKQIESKIIKS